MSEHTLYLDIETVPAPESVQPEIEVSPPGNMKKPETIEKWWQEEGDACRREKWEKTALDGWQGSICVAAMAVGDGAVHHSIGDEAGIIKAIFSLYKPGVETIALIAPVEGSSGGAMSGLSMIGASGSEAACTFDTRAAPKNPAAEVRKNCLRSITMRSSSMSAAARGIWRCSSGDAFDPARRPADQRHLETGLRDRRVRCRSIDALDLEVDAGVAQVLLDQLGRLGRGVLRDLDRLGHCLGIGLAQTQCQRGPAGLLAGDAAHQAPPVGVHSMNSGLVEARELAARIATREGDIEVSITT